MENKQLTSLLNDLLEYLHDSYKGYRECADIISSKKLANLFNSLAASRQTMIDAIKSEVSRLGQTPKASGSVTGVLHRLFVDLKNTLTSNNIDSIINEIKRGENTLINQYKEILREEDLPENIRAILSNELGEIEKNLVNVDALSAIP